MGEYNSILSACTTENSVALAYRLVFGKRCLN